jgi:folate-binding protein YgfZ
MSERNDLAVLSFTGTDAARFLHNQLTVDVESLEPGQASFAALCQPKGRVIALLCIGATENGFTVLCHESLADGLLAHLKRFVFRDQVTLERREDLRVVSVGSGDSTEVAFEPLPGFRYGVSEDPVPDSSPFPAAVAERARELEAGITWLDTTSTETFLPQMLGHEVLGALNFRKGCFPGQEVIARTRYLGKLKRHPWSGVVDEKLPIPVLGELTLANGPLEAPGVMVDQEERDDGRWQVFVVARRPEAFDVATLGVAKRDFPTEGHWINDALPPREAGKD